MNAPGTHRSPCPTASPGPNREECAPLPLGRSSHLGKIGNKLGKLFRGAAAHWENCFLCTFFFTFDFSFFCFGPGVTFSQHMVLVEVDVQETECRELEVEPSLVLLQPPALP